MQNDIVFEVEQGGVVSRYPKVSMSTSTPPALYPQESEKVICCSIESKTPIDFKLHPQRSL